MPTKRRHQQGDDVDSTVQKKSVVCSEIEESKSIAEKCVLNAACTACKCFFLSCMTIFWIQVI